MFQSTRRAGTHYKTGWNSSVSAVFQSTPRARAATGAYADDYGTCRVSIHAPRAGRDQGRGGWSGADRVSIHAPRAGRDESAAPSVVSESLFQSTRPARDATRRRMNNGQRLVVSIHAPRAGRDLMLRFSKALFKSFNPRAPRGRIPGGQARRPGDICFQSRPARTHGSLRRSTRENVSIHAPRAGRDKGGDRGRPGHVVSIHAPRAGRDPSGISPPSKHRSFQSTRPARDATYRFTGRWRESACFNPRAPRGTRQRRAGFGRRRRRCFNPRAPRGTRLILAHNITHRWDVSIHAPRAGRDSRIFTPVDGVWRFQSTRPARDATSRRRKSTRAPTRFQSTRPARARPAPAALTVGSGTFQSTRPARDATCSGPGSTRPITGFNPRAPRGTRLSGAAGLFVLFGSIHAPPRGTRRADSSPKGSRAHVSIHAPRAGPRLARSKKHSTPSLFQSTRPARDATQALRHASPPLRFQSTRPARDATGGSRIVCWDARLVSIHAPRAGRDLRRYAKAMKADAFQSTRPARDATLTPVTMAPGHACFNPRAPRGTRRAA